MSDRFDAMAALFRAMLQSRLIFARGPGREQAMAEGVAELVLEGQYGDAGVILAELCCQVEAQESDHGLVASVAQCIREGNYDAAMVLIEERRQQTRDQDEGEKEE